MAGLIAERDRSSKIEARHLETVIKSETSIDRLRELEERMRKLKQLRKGLSKL